MSHPTCRRYPRTTREAFPNTHDWWEGPTRQRSGIGSKLFAAALGVIGAITLLHWLGA